MDSQRAELMFLVTRASRYLPVIRNIVRTIREHFANGCLADMQVGGWVARDMVGILLSLDKEASIPETLKTLGIWVQDLHVTVIELDKLVPPARSQIVREFHETADIMFSGLYYMEAAVREIVDMFILIHGDEKTRERYLEELDRESMSQGNPVSE